MKLLSAITLLLLIACSLSAQADNVQWRDASGRFRLIMLDPASTAYPVLFYGSTQRSGTDCPNAGECSFVLRGRPGSGQTLVFDALTLHASSGKTAGLEGHQSELPGHLATTETMVWSFYSTDATQARLTCISPKASCDYFHTDIILEQEPTRARHP